MAKIQILFQKYRQLIPILLLGGFCIFTIITAVDGKVEMAGGNYEFDLTTKHFVAFAAFIINLISFFLFRPFYKYLLVLTLFLGVLNLINFTPLETIIWVAFGDFKIPFQPTSLLLVFFTYIINFKRTNELFSKFIAPTAKQQERRTSEEIERFMNRYKSYSNEELNQILIENRFVPEALEAARKLLDLQQDKLS